MKSLFEQMGGTYTQQGDYFLPDLRLPPEDERPVGIWGQRRLCYLWEHHPILYTNLKTKGQLHIHLADIEEQANALFLRLFVLIMFEESIPYSFESSQRVIPSSKCFRTISSFCSLDTCIIKNLPQ